MEGSYAEAGVKKKDTITMIAIRIAMIVVAVLLFLIAFYNQLMMLLAAGLICLDILLIPLMKVDYEYIFCDGQLDFDRINGGARRKNILRIDLEETEIVAPKNSHSLDEYRKNGEVIVKDFTSGRDTGKIYVIIARQNGQLIKVMFEPSEKMISCMKNKAPRKVIEY